MKLQRLFSTQRPSAWLLIFFIVAGIFIALSSQIGQGALSIATEMLATLLDAVFRGMMEIINGMDKEIR